MTGHDDPPGAPASGTDYRLPAAVRPHRYELHLAPDLEAATFTGSARIEIEVSEPVVAVVCHALELEVGPGELVPGWRSAGEGEGRSPALRLEAQPREQLQQLAFTAGEEIPAGRYTLSCGFSGVLNDRLRGFYRSTFRDAAGEERVIAVTQFEETAARRAFPCFDEPDAKAVFAVTLDAPPGMVALSNGPEVAAEDLPGGGRRVRFGETIPMSTYLVAFVVGPLELTAPRDAAGTPLRLAHLAGQSRLTGPALDAAAHALGFYASYFGIPYPAGKLDLVSLPDFAAGAMENLGCVTFREAILLADPERTGRVELERLVEVVDHELAHMWFGDLVTMRWWNGIWLNEAFATFMALCCEDDYRPDWHVFTSFARSRAAAQSIDALHSTRPIEFPVRQPEDAAAMFDVLTYEKGASVLWMLERYLRPERFRDGVRAYLATHAYGNTETTDLWDAIGALAPEVPVRSIMESWLLQGGHPLVRARAVEDGAGGRAVELTQEPFAYLPAETAAEIGTAPAAGSAIGASWLVPVLATHLPASPGGGGRKESEPVRVLLGEAPLRVPAGEGPLVVNAGGTGFYRLSYDDALRAALLDRIGELTPLERFNLLGDSWATTLAGSGELDEVLEIIGRLGHETDPHVWALVTSALGLLDLLAAEDERPAVGAYARALLGPRLGEVGWGKRAGEDEQAPLLRSTLVAALGTTGADAEVVATARDLFAGDHFGDRPLDPDISSAVLGVVAAHCDDAELEASVERYRRPRDPMDGIRHLYSLARLSDPARVERVLGFSLAEVRTQNAPILIGAMLQNRVAGPIAFAFVRENFETMCKRFPDNLVPRMLEGVAGLAGLDADGRPRLAGEVRRFCREAVSGPRRRLVDQSLERLEVNVRLAQRLRGSLAKTLAGS